MKKFLFFFLMLTAFSGICLGSEPIKITKVSAQKMGAYDQIEILTSGKTTPQIMRLDPNNRLALIFENASIDKTFNVRPSSSKIKR